MNDKELTLEQLDEMIENLENIIKEGEQDEEKN